MREIDSFPGTTFVHLAQQNSNLSIRKQSPRNFLIKNEENMQQIHRRTPTLKCDFEKTAA